LILQSVYEFFDTFYFKFYLYIIWSQLVSMTFRICKVGDCGLQNYQTVTILKRATTVEFTTISPILYIHCYGLAFLFPLNYL
jgi:hypothetical protein